MTAGSSRPRPRTSSAATAQHQIRYGVDYEHLDFSQLIRTPGPTFTAPNGQQTATGAVVDILPDPIFGQIYHVAAPA